MTLVIPRRAAKCRAVAPPCAQAPSKCHAAQRSPGVAADHDMLTHLIRSVHVCASFEQRESAVLYS